MWGVEVGKKSCAVGTYLYNEIPDEAFVLRCVSFSFFSQSTGIWFQRGVDRLEVLHVRSNILA